MSIFTKHATGVAIAFSSIVGLASPANAAFITSSQGVDFTFTVTHPNAFTLQIDGAPAATGNWANAEAISALGFKDLGIDFSQAGVSAMLTSSPVGTTTWTYLQGELDSKGCKDPGGQNGVICFTGLPPLTLTSSMLFTVNIVGATLNIDHALGPHLKVNFWDTDVNKKGETIGQIGDLLSVNLTHGTTTVPAPSVLALLGVGLAAAGAGTFRRRQPLCAA